MKTVILLLFISLIGVSATCQDPNPRFEMLGVEELETHSHTGAPAKVFVYKDKATGSEILCFAGEMRETLSCLSSGRNRGK